MIFKLRLTTFICLFSIFLSSCGTEPQNQNSNSYPSFEDYRASLAERSKLKTEELLSARADTGSWWDCHSYERDSIYLATKSTTPWNLFGYCLSEIGNVLIDYIQVELYNNPNTFYQSTSFREIRQGGKERFNTICKSLVTAAIAEMSKSPFEGNKNVEFVTPKVLSSINAGCVSRFVDIFDFEVLRSKLLKIKSESESQQQSSKDEENESSNSTTPDSNLENNRTNSEKNSQQGRWVVQCRYEYVPNPNFNPNSTDLNTRDTRSTIPVQKCSQVFVAN